jgi:hypothetical protein
MRDVEPRGATYSEVKCISERHGWPEGEEAAHLRASILGRAYYRLVGTDWEQGSRQRSPTAEADGNTDMYNSMPSSHNGRSQSLRRDALGIALVRTCTASVPALPHTQHTHVVELGEIQARGVQHRRERDDGEPDDERRDCVLVRRVVRGLPRRRGHRGRRGRAHCMRGGRGVYACGTRRRGR